MRTALPTASSNPAAQCLELELNDYLLAIDCEMIRIGSSPVCELRLPSGPMLHSMIRSEEGVLWIEAADDTTDLMVNWRNCRRLTLQEGDVISAAGHDITVQHPAAAIADEAARLAEELSHLPAEELCDRILSEQSAVDEFESGRLRGWQRLMAAIQDAMSDESIEQTLEQHEVLAADAPVNCDRLLDQIHEITEFVNGRGHELDVRESELAAATAVLQETQDRVSRQIDELLDQIGEVAAANELRASA